MKLTDFYCGLIAGGAVGAAVTTWALSGLWHDSTKSQKHPRRNEWMAGHYVIPGSHVFHSGYGWSKVVRVDARPTEENGRVGFVCELEPVDEK